MAQQLQQSFTYGKALKISLHTFRIPLNETIQSYLLAKSKSWQLQLTGPVRLQHQLPVYNVLKLQGKFPMLTDKFKCNN